MKVLQIANGYLEKGLYRNLFHHLELLEVNCQVFVPVINGYKKNTNEKDVIVLECFNSFDRYLFFSKQRKTIKGIINNYDLKTISIIHAHTLFSTGYSAYRIHKKFGIPYVVAVRNTDVNLFFEKFSIFKKIGLRIMLNASNVVFISPEYKRMVIDKYIPPKFKEEIDAKSVVIPNGIDDYYLENIYNDKNELHNPVRIIHVGDIDYNKNILTTIKAIELLKNNNIECNYTLIGDIKDLEVGEVIKEKEYIRHLGKQPKEVVLEKLRQSDIFVMPSHHETFGLVYGEAMSQGLPVIYTKGQGFDGQFENGEVGFAVDDYDPDSIAKAIIDVIEQYNNISATCKRNVNSFSWSIIAKKYLDLYSQSSPN